MLPVNSNSALIVPSDQDYTEDVFATQEATEALDVALFEQNHPFQLFTSGVFLTHVIYDLSLTDLFALRNVSCASRSIADNLCVKREVVCENWGFGIRDWNAVLGKVTNPPLPLSCIERVFAKIIVRDPYTPSESEYFSHLKGSKVFYKKRDVFEKYVFYFTPETVNNQDYSLLLLKTLLKGHKTTLKIDRHFKKKITNAHSGRAHWTLMRKTAETEEVKCRTISAGETVTWLRSCPPYYLQQESLQEGDQIGSPLEIATGIALRHLISDGVTYLSIQSAEKKVEIVGTLKGDVSVERIFPTSRKPLGVLPILRV